MKKTIRKPTVRPPATVAMILGNFAAPPPPRSDEPAPAAAAEPEPLPVGENTGEAADPG